MIEDLCKKLKDKRKELGYDLEDVVESTKLHPSVIKAIENLSLGEMNPVYIKGFIRIYASFLGVAIGNDLESLAPVKTHHKTIHPKRQSFKHKTDFIKPLTFKAKRNIIFSSVLLASLIIIIMLIVSIVRLVRYKVPPHANNRNYSEKSNATAKGVSSYKGKGVAVSFRVKRDCFVRVKRDGKVISEGVLKKGIVESWQASKELEFSINDGSSVVVEVNGKVLPPLSKIYKPIKSLRITPKGISIVK